jgi:hypothetical protein
MVRAKVEYMIYGADTLPVFFGKISECAGFLQTSTNTLLNTASRIRNGKLKSMKNGYTIWRIEGEGKC